MAFWIFCVQSPSILRTSKNPKPHTPNALIPGGQQLQHPGLQAPPGRSSPPREVGEGCRRAPTAKGTRVREAFSKSTETWNLGAKGHAVLGLFEARRSTVKKRVCSGAREEAGLFWRSCWASLQGSRLGLKEVQRNSDSRRKTTDTGRNEPGR